MAARIYIRRNGSFGASVPDCRDTGHVIHEDSGRFRVWSIGDGGEIICEDANRAHAEKAIYDDWMAN